LKGPRLENVEFFIAIWNVLQTFGIFYDHLVHFVFIWYTFPGLGNIYQENSGNPVRPCELICIIADADPVDASVSFASDGGWGSSSGRAQRISAGSA
jgi:hypothetical protein